MTIEITKSQIRTLRQEAATAGDAEMVAIATKALEGHGASMLACFAAIREAQAQQESAR